MTMLGENAHPESNMQFSFSIFMSMIGIVVFSTIIGALSALLSSMDKLGEAKQEQLDSINQYMAFRRVNKPLQLRIRAYYKYLWESGQSGHQKGLFDELPPGLDFQLTLSLKEDMVVNVPMFRRCEPQTVLAIIKLLKSAIAIPEELVIKQGFPTRRMYFCLRGKLQVCVQVGEGYAATEVEVAQLTGGSCFGATALFNPEHVASASVRTLMHCELESLPFSDLERLMVISPGLAKEIKDAARNNFLKTITASRNRERLEEIEDENKQTRWLAKKYKKDREKFNLVAKLHEHSKAHSNSLQALQNFQEEEQRRIAVKSAGVTGSRAQEELNFSGALGEFSPSPSTRHRSIGARVHPARDGAEMST